MASWRETSQFCTNHSSLLAYTTILPTSGHRRCLTLSCASLACSVTSRSCSCTSARLLQDTAAWLQFFSHPLYPHINCVVPPGEGGDPGLESLELRRQSPVQSPLCHHLIMQAAEHTPSLPVPAITTPTHIHTLPPPPPTHTHTHTLPLNAHTHTPPQHMYTTQKSLTL